MPLLQTRMAALRGAQRLAVLYVLFRLLRSVRLATRAFAAA